MWFGQRFRHFLIAVSSYRSLDDGVFACKVDEFAEKVEYGRLEAALLAASHNLIPRIWANLVCL